MPASCLCGRKWTGLAQAHCSGSGCHRHFGSVQGFDRHRATGRCVDPATILDKHGRRVLKASESAHGTTWVRDNPSGHYRNAGKAA